MIFSYFIPEIVKFEFAPKCSGHIGCMEIDVKNVLADSTKEAMRKGRREVERYLKRRLGVYKYYYSSCKIKAYHLSLMERVFVANYRYEMSFRYKYEWSK